MSEPPTVVGYMCRIDWDHELGIAIDGNRVYPSLAALKERHTMWEKCGVVEVAVTLQRVVVKGTDP